MSTVMHLAFIYELLYIVQSLFQSVLFLRPTHGVVAYGTFNGDDGERETGKECSQCQGVIKWNTFIVFWLIGVQILITHSDLFVTVVIGQQASGSWGQH